jgi:glutamate-1-semialdehyde 2,1-aminomutase
VPASFAQETLVLPYNDRSALDAAFTTYADQIACVILEPYPANVGLILPEAGYLTFLRELCSRHQVVLIFDEVMTGFRLAKGGVQELENVTPDLTTLGKIIGGGLPVGALGPVYQAGTLSGNPLAMAAGIAALKLLEKENPYPRLATLGQQIRDTLLAAAKRKGLPVQVPKVGSMFSLFFTPTPVRDYATALRGDAALFGKFFRLCLDRGVYLPPSAYETAFLSTAHEGPSIARACDVFEEALQTL